MERAQEFFSCKNVVKSELPLVNIFKGSRQLYFSQLSEKETL